MINKEKIIVLKTFKHGESDLIVHGLNTLGARINFFARGALKSRKRFGGGVLEPTHYLEVSYKVAYNSDSDPLHSLLEAQLIREFSSLRTDYKRLETALHFVKVIHKLSQQGVVDSPELFNLLGNALSATEKSQALNVLKVMFELKLLSGQGVLPFDERFQIFIQIPIAEHEKVKTLYANRHDQKRGSASWLKDGPGEISGEIAESGREESHFTESQYNQFSWIETQAHALLRNYLGQLQEPYSGASPFHSRS